MDRLGHFCRWLGIFKIFKFPEKMNADEDLNEEISVLAHIYENLRVFEHFGVISGKNYLIIDFRVKI